MKKGYGSCPGTCGELVQGISGNKESISSYCIDLFSRVMVWDSDGGAPTYKTRKRKSLDAIGLVFEHFGYDKSESEKLNIIIKSNIPVGKGMASSTADIGASVMAVLDYLNRDMSPDLISKLVAKIEPTDSIFHKEVCIFDPINGEVRESLGLLANKKVLVLEPNSKISTVRLRGNKSYHRDILKNKWLTDNSFEMLKRGFRSGDVDLIGKACKNSAFANELIKKTPFLEEIIEISERHRFDFVNIAHTGTVVGMVFDEDRNIKNVIDELRDSRISEEYKRIYVRSVIDGGLRRGDYDGRLHKKT